jgi:hypothetical protein
MTNEINPHQLSDTSNFFNTNNDTSRLHSDDDPTLEIPIIDVTENLPDREGGACSRNTLYMVIGAPVRAVRLCVYGTKLALYDARVFAAEDRGIRE